MSTFTDTSEKGFQKYIVKELECSISDSLFIGDRQDKDGKCALNAGFKFVKV